MVNEFIGNSEWIMVMINGQGLHLDYQGDKVPALLEQYNLLGILFAQFIEIHHGHIPPPLTIIHDPSAFSFSISLPLIEQLRHMRFKRPICNINSDLLHQADERSKVMN